MKTLFVTIVLIISLTVPAIAFNPSHNKLMKMGDWDQRGTLGMGVLYAGYDCQYPKMAFFQGLDENKTAYWSLDCETRSFQITIKNDADGEMTVVPCDKLYPGEVPCFTPLEKWDSKNDKN